MRKLTLTTIAAVVATVTCLTGLLGMGQASAAPIAQLTTTGNDFGTFGNHSFCRGSVHIGLQAPARKPGVVRVTATSHGFTGDGTSWKRTPRCKVVFRTIFTSARGYLLHHWTPASFGPRPGEKRTWDVHTGSGVVSFTVNTTHAKGELINQQSAGFGAFLAVP
ncbi:enoyl-CoA hydratase [Gordonia jinghuaiqii]|uniref:Enoyl-CoA hydratase n=1 Tax=Gordonia jinghuaiqii TaxID=2758710 RepID=A0A7D7LWB9_9ACTN|nr:enoyl-CoA hydratase [Gordonia jinghuaiqii]MCR5980185.1 enoyl-CoA hydratase [Gordonia jinghuaiqii]QMT02055.1 enoyl-CoA hydratase [Gordonia jinghuaiqii]